MSGIHWVTGPNEVLEPKLHPSGFGALPPITVAEVLRQTVEKHGDKRAMCLKRPVNGVVPDDWKVWTWRDYWNDCKAFAKCLIHLGETPFSVVNICGFNSPEWLLANTGAILASCIAAGIYTTNTADACHYISEHSKAGVVVLEDNKQLQKYANMTAGSLPNLKCIVIWIGNPDEALMAKISVPVYTWDQFLVLGSDVSDAVFDERLSIATPGHCSTLIYTSGTTGPPKAVMISHDNVTWTTKNMCSNYFDTNHQDRVISYLPLSHIAAQLIDVHVPMSLGACTYFCQPDALKGSLTVTMREVRPTVFFGVPRVWEKIEEKMVQMGRASVGIKKSIATWAKANGTENTKRAQFGGRGGHPWSYGCANSIVLSKIKEALGLDQCKGNFTAAAPIAPETLWYFGSLDIPVYEVFGQSECTGPHTVSFANQWKIGACGRPMLGTESMIVPANGELCYRGRHIFMGYMYDAAKTAETIDEQGYLHSGDVAEFDNDDDVRVSKPSGFMRITGRIKELIITAGGENIPPVLIENEMKAAMVALSNVMVIGDKRKYLAMLICLKVEVDLETGIPSDKLAADSLFVGRNIDSTATTLSEAVVDPLWIKYINEGMKTANGKTTSNAQIVQKWKMLPVDFSEKAGDLTPTLKLKRNVVTAKYTELIETIYADGGDN